MSATATNYEVSTEGLTDAEVLVALYNGSKVQGMGFLSSIDEPLTIEAAEALIGYGTSPDYGDIGNQLTKPRDGSAYFDYLYGRVMKITLNGSGVVNTALYDRDLGEGHGAAVIAAARAAKEAGEPVG